MARSDAKQIGSTNLDAIFSDLSSKLEAKEKGRTWGLVICGGAAMISLGLKSTNTKDVDVLEPEIDATLRHAAADVGVRYGLESDWINNGPSSLIPHLPADWKARLVPVFRSAALVVYSIGRPELLISKLWAEADRQQDIDDLLALSPSESELETAAQLVETFDANPHWPVHVARTVDKVLKVLAKKS